jgi:hypothetical protein
LKQTGDTKISKRSIAGADERQEGWDAFIESLTEMGFEMV